MFNQTTCALQNQISKSICLTLLIGAVAVASAGQSAQTCKTVNAVYRIGGQSMGTYTEKRQGDVDGGVVTTIASDMIFNRLGNKLELKSASTYHEGRSGELTALENTQP
jgi:hypothetical protein